MPSTNEPGFLQAVVENPEDDTPRLIYADWLEENGSAERAELIRVCQTMRQTPVFADAYWRLKARRNELRLKCPADWLAATGYDGSRYDPVYRDGIPSDWKGRWRLIREFCERWHGIPTGDVGGRRDVVRAEEQRLGRSFPPSLQEYVAYAHDVAPPREFLMVHRDFYTMEPLVGQPALSIMVIGEGGVHWSIRDEDFGLPDPPIYTYYGEDDNPPFTLADHEGSVIPTLSAFVLGFVIAYKDNAGCFRTTVRDPTWLREQLEGAFPIRLSNERGTTYEGDGILADLYPAHFRPGFDLTVNVHRLTTWERVPDFIWPYARHAHMRGGMFLSEQDLEQSRRHWGDQPPPEVLAPAPPPLQGWASEPPGLRGNDDIPF